MNRRPHYTVLESSLKDPAYISYKKAEKSLKVWNRKKGKFVSKRRSAELRQDKQVAMELNKVAIQSILKSPIYVHTEPVKKGILEIMMASEESFGSNHRNESPRSK